MKREEEAILERERERERERDGGGRRARKGNESET